MLAGSALSAADAARLRWEALWKTIWLLLVPQWLNGRVDPATAATALECSLVMPAVLVVVLDILWRRVCAVRTESG